eukprot:5928753-Pleurochrysis_carterae.AAC.2
MLLGTVQVSEYLCALADPSAAKEHLPCGWKSLFGSCKRALQNKCRRCERAGGAAPALPPGLANRIRAASTSKLRDEYVVYSGWSRRLGLPSARSSSTTEQRDQAVQFSSAVKLHGGAA